MSKCAICKIGDRVFSCDKCSKLVCDGCSDLTSTEVRCLELKNRSLIFYCKSCISLGQIDEIDRVVTSKVQEAFGVLTSMFESFKNEFMCLASEKLTGLPEHNKSPPAQSYADVVSNSLQRSVIVKPKNTSQKNSKTKLDLVDSIDPVGSEIKINTVKHIKNGGLIVGCVGEQDADKFVKLADEKLSSEYDVHVLKKILPRIRLAGISEKFNSDVLEEYILKQNTEVFRGSSSCKILRISSIKNKNALYQATVQLDRFSYERALKAGYLLVGLDVCRIFDAVEVSRCYKCNGFNHKSSVCRQALTCPRCGACHEVKSCVATDAELSCINCKKINQISSKSYDVKHAVWDSQNCRAYKLALERLRGNIFGPK